MSKPTNKSDPLHELLFCVLALSHIRRYLLPRRVFRSKSFCVRQCLATVEKEKQEYKRKNMSRIPHRMVGKNDFFHGMKAFLLNDGERKEF